MSILDNGDTPVFGDVRVLVVEAGTEVKSFHPITGEEQTATVDDETGVTNGSLMYVTQYGYDRLVAAIEAQGVKTK